MTLSSPRNCPAPFEWPISKREPGFQSELAPAENIVVASGAHAVYPHQMQNRVGKGLSPTTPRQPTFGLNPVADNERGG
jgi:hypothetical protein